MKRELRILLVDDHEMVRNGIKLMLSKQNSFVPIIDEAVDGNEAISMAVHNTYDVILLDINIPKRDGVCVAKYLISKDKSVKILVLSTHKEDYVIKQMVAVGVLGYLLKSTGLEELTNAILTVSESLRYYSNEVSQTLFSSSNVTPFESKDRPKVSSFDSTLTKREKEIVYLITNEFTNTEISTKLKLSKRTIDAHRNNILTKLQLKNTAGIVKYAFQNGIV